MGEDNQNFLRNHMVDYSDGEQFRFVLNCPICATRWESDPVRMSSGATAEGFVGKTYQNERITALNESADRAQQHFDRCPMCGKLACRSCIVTYQELTMCKTCLAALKDRMEKRKGGIGSP